MRLWDLTIGWTAFPHLYELRRPKTTADQAHVEARFAPCFDARDWAHHQPPGGVTEFSVMGLAIASQVLYIGNSVWIAMATR